MLPIKIECVFQKSHSILNLQFHIKTKKNKFCHYIKKFLPFFKNKEYGKNNKHKANKIIPPELFFKIKNRKETKNKQSNNFLNSF